MPATVVGLVAQFLIHPYLNTIVELYKNRDLKKLNKLILKLIFMIVAFGIISSLLAYFLGPEVLGLVYGIDLKAYRVGLLIIIINRSNIFISINSCKRNILTIYSIYNYISICNCVLKYINKAKRNEWGCNSIFCNNGITIYNLYNIYKHKIKKNL